MSDEEGMTGDRGVRVRRFEDLIAWQKARRLVRAVYVATQRESFRRDVDLKRQIRRASVSILSNIAEGYERGRRGEFYHFLSIAKASCAEVRSQLYVALDVGYVDEATFTQLMNESREVGRIIGGLRISVQPKPKAPTNHP